MNTVPLNSAQLTKIDLTPRIGTEIKADIETLLSGKYAAEIRETLQQRGVLIFRDLHMSKAQQKEFGVTLGKVQGMGGDGILPITLDKTINAFVADYLKGSFFWHIDGASDDVPNFAALLNAHVLSETGGQTLFANTYAAWDDLPEDEKAAIEGLRVVHSMEASQRLFVPVPTYEELQRWQLRTPKVHPLVWKHGSGRKSLLLGATTSHVEGMSLEAGRLLLCKLQEWATQPQFVYRHEWRVGDLLIWDNTGTMHRVEPYAEDSGRLMSRTTLEAEEGVA